MNNIIKHPLYMKINYLLYINIYMIIEYNILFITFRNEMAKYGNIKDIILFF